MKYLKIIVIIFCLFCPLISCSNEKNIDQKNMEKQHFTETSQENIYSIIAIDKENFIDVNVNFTKNIVDDYVEIVINQITLYCRTSDINITKNTYSNKLEVITNEENVSYWVKGKLEFRKNDEDSYIQYSICIYENSR